MESGERNAGSQVAPVGAPEYTAGSAARHRSAGTTRRNLYFCLASIWGFIAGVGGLLVATSAADRPMRPSPGAIPLLIPALIIAAAGGLVIAAAYRESKRRAR